MCPVRTNYLADIGSYESAMLKAKPKIWTETEKRLLARLVPRGAGAAEISKELGRYAGSVRCMAREMKLLLKK